MFAFLAAHRAELFPDEMFADLFPTGRGRPSVPADVMAAVITLQALHGLSDSETVDAVTFDLRWKTACGMPVSAGAFHATTLTYWRRRLAASDRPNRIFEAVKAVVAADRGADGEDAAGVGFHGARRRGGHPGHRDPADRRDPAGAPRGARCRRGDRRSTAPPMTTTTRVNRRSPGTTPQAREQLVDALVSDAHRLLGHLPEQELGPRAAEAVALLALIAGQDVEPVEGSDGTDGRWRIAQQVAPDRVISTVDPDARHAHKSRVSPPGRVQGACGRRTRHRHHHRLRADQGQRRRQPRSGRRDWSCSPARTHR